MRPGEAVEAGRRVMAAARVAATQRSRDNQIRRKELEAELAELDREEAGHERVAERADEDTL